MGLGKKQYFLPSTFSEWSWTRFQACEPSWRSRIEHTSSQVLVKDVCDLMMSVGQLGRRGGCQAEQ